MWMIFLLAPIAYDAYVLAGAGFVLHAHRAHSADLEAPYAREPQRLRPLRGMQAALAKARPTSAAPVRARALEAASHALAHEELVVARPIDLGLPSLAVGTQAMSQQLRVRASRRRLARTHEAAAGRPLLELEPVLDGLALFEHYPTRRPHNHRLHGEVDVPLQVGRGVRRAQPEGPVSSMWPLGLGPPATPGRLPEESNVPPHLQDGSVPHSPGTRRVSRRFR